MVWHLFVYFFVVFRAAPYRFDPVEESRRGKLPTRLARKVLKPPPWARQQLRAALSFAVVDLREILVFQ
jgi:hypothetical protein